MSTTPETDLSKKMRARAKQDGAPAAHLVELADAFDRVCEGYYAVKQTVTVGEFMAHWGRARAAWCRYSGEPLL